LIVASLLWGSFGPGQAPAFAAPGDPFDCSKTGKVWIAASPSGSQQTALYQAQTDSSGTVAFNPEGAASTYWYNAIGFNQADNYLYGLRRDSTNDNHLIRIGQGGVVTDLGAVPGLPNVAGAEYYNQGTMGTTADGTANNLYVLPSSPNTGSGVNTLYRIQVTAPRSATLITLSRNVPNLSDIFYLDGYLWGIAGGGDAFRINPTTGQVLEITGAAAAAIPGGSFGGQFVYGNGNIGLVNNGSTTGDLYQLHINGTTSANPTFTLIGHTTAPTSTNNDATACPGPNVDMSIIKTGPPGYRPGSQVSYTLTVKNNGPGDSSGSIVTDVLPSSLTNASTTTPGCSLSGQTLTCSLPPLAVGDTFAITVTSTAVTSATGIITNTATVTGNEKDPNPGNNTDTVDVPPSNNTCNTVWYVTNTPLGGSDVGTFGTVNPATGAWSQVGILADQSSALAIDPNNPNVAYYIGWNAATAAPDGRLYRLDLVTGTSTLLNTTSNSMFLSNRMAMAPDGTLWTMSSNGHLWSTTPTATTIGTPVDHGLLVPPPTTNGGTLTGGDIAFDGLGNMWVIASDSQLYTISSTELAGTSPNATFVGTMGNQNFPGLAFTSNGNLYANTGGGAASLYQVNPATGATTQVATAGPTSTGDLASCAMPKPILDATKAVSPSGAVEPGTVLTYTIAVPNTGVLAATGVTLTDQIPANTTYVAGSTALNGTPVPDVAGAFPYATATQIHSPGAFDGVIAPGATAIVTFKVKVDDPVPAGVTQVANQGTIKFTGVPPTPIPTDDPSTPTPDDPTVTPLILPAYEVSKSADPASGSTVSPGDTITYTLTATGMSGTARNIVLTDDLSAVLNHATFVAGSAMLTVAGGAPNPVAGPTGTTLASPAFTLGNNEIATLVYKVKIASDAWGVTIGNSVTATSPGGPPSGPCGTSATPCTTTHPTPMKIYLRKVDRSGQALSGSQWKVQVDSGGTPGAVVLPGAEVVTAADGLFQISGLGAGSYWLTEVKAPSGYNLLAEPIKITLAANGAVTVSDGSGGGTAVVGTHSGDNLPQITVRDVARFSLPSSGGSGASYLYVIAGLCLLGVAVGVVLIPALRRRTTRQRGEH
jgi:uncharacterized repeat protein (TIGR01451 family)